MPCGKLVLDDSDVPSCPIQPPRRFSGSGRLKVVELSTFTFAALSVRPNIIMAVVPRRRKILVLPQGLSWALLAKRLYTSPSIYQVSHTFVVGLGG